MPSFRPLSILIACRILSGTALAETTDCPSAASVGASSAASNAASQIENAGNIATAVNVPAAMASGSPISSMRTGRL